MKEILPSHPCPICLTPVAHWERYPLAVCRDCHNKARNAQGQKLSFFNQSMSGGFEAVITDTQEKYLSHICYIEENKCWADEARFGGIVIQPYTKQPFEQDDLMG